MKLSRVLQLRPALAALIAVVVCTKLPAQEKHWPDSWTIVPSAGEVVFAVDPVGDSDHANLHVRNERNIGQLFMNTAIPVNGKTTLKWRWNVRNIPSDVAEDTPGTHQYYAVAVRFDNDQVLSYIWSATLPEGSGFPCPLPAWKDRETHIVLHSGNRDFGKWLAEERNVLADYTQYKKSGPPASIVQVWVIAAAMTGDGDMTLADISVSDGRTAKDFLAGRGFSARDQAIPAVHPAGTANPQAAVDRRIETYNRHDLEGFLLAHAENVEIYSFPERRLGTGRSHLRKVLASRFNDRAVQVEVLRQIVFDRFVVSDEVIRETDSNRQIEHYVAIYEVLDNQIVSLRLMERR